MNRSRGGAAYATFLLGTLLPSFPLRAQESRVQELNTQVGQLVRQGRFDDAVSRFATYSSPAKLQWSLRERKSTMTGKICPAIGRICPCWPMIRISSKICR